MKYMNEIQLKKTDSSIKKISKYRYEFEYDNRTYVFNAFKTTSEIYTAYWAYISDDGSEYIDLPPELKERKQKTKVFSKVLTCIYQFLNDNMPEQLIFTANKKMEKLYGYTIIKYQKEYPLNKYIITSNFKNDTVQYHMSRKVINLSESDWDEIIKSSNEILKENGVIY